MPAPSPPPLVHAARNGVWTRHFRTAPDRTASSPQIHPAEPAWWHCCRGKRGACLYFTAETTKGTKYHEAWRIAQPSCSFVPFVVCSCAAISAQSECSGSDISAQRNPRGDESAGCH